jgi:RNA polymerase-binding protein DksA
MKRHESDVTARSLSQLLRVERAGVEAQIASLMQDFADMVEASASSNADDEHDPEGSTIAFERAQLAAVLALEQSRLESIDEALVRLDDGRYGACVRCGGPIGAERLAARPSAETCIDCARQAGA